jgi:hypothetical protein
MSNYPGALRCTCDSDGEDYPLGANNSPPKKKPRQGRGYKQNASIQHKSLVASLQRARKFKQRQAILASAPDSFLKYLLNQTRRLASGAVRVSPAQRKRLLPYRRTLIELAKVNNLKQLRRRISTGGRPQRGGILPFLPFLFALGPLLAKGLAVGAATAAGGFAVKKALGSIKDETVPQTGSGAYRRNGRTSRYYY